jgi:hypothetical protein
MAATPINYSLNVSTGTYTFMKYWNFLVSPARLFYVIAIGGSFIF